MNSDDLATYINIEEILAAPEKFTLNGLVKRTVKNVYRSQGYYSALSFLINCGLAPKNDRAAAETELDKWIK